jgi:excisionase family DNA binding protein|tara:strand:+ start:1220 stop:1528 length:309 start_codon:yes stop_codon:yes gene_type:complete
MKIEIDETQLINDIVEKVIERLTPLLRQNSKSSDNELMTVEELTVYLKTKKSSIYDKVHTRSIPFLKYTSSLRFRKKHIDIWLSNPYHPDLDNYNLNHNGRG